MADSVFDLLVNDLNDEERIKLLESIKNSTRNSKFSDDLDFPRPTLNQDIDYKYAQFSIFQKIVIWFQVFFKKIDFYKAVEGRLYEKLKDKLDFSNKGVLDSKTETVTNYFIENLDKLYAQISVLQAPFNTITTYGKEGFFAFLVNFIYPDTTREFLRQLNPDFLIGSDGINSEAEIKDKLNNTLNFLLDGFDQNKRDYIYKLSKQFFYLQKIMDFKFSEFIRDCKKSKTVFEMSEYFINLSMLINSMPKEYDEILISAIFLFNNSMSNKSISESEVSFWTNSVYSMLKDFSIFSKTIPVADLASYALNDVIFTPDIIVGGEDWISLFKNYWRKYKDSLALDFIKDFKIKKIEENFLSFFDIGAIKLLNNYSISAWSKYGILIYFEHSIALIDYLVKNFIPKIKKVLDIVLKEGKFYKKSNKESLIEALEFLESFRTYIFDLDNLYSEKGEFGKLVKNCFNDLGLQLKKDLDVLKVSSLKRQQELSSKIKDFIEKFTLVGEIINGILYGKVGGTYDTLSNISHIGGRNNERLLESFNTLYNNIVTLSVIIKDVSIIENSSFRFK